MTTPADNADGEVDPAFQAPLVSIIIPCYRQAQYLPECVASVLGQTYGAWELIIVDDGSPDECAAIAERIIAENTDKIIRLIRRENGGVSRARNTGITEARGKYVLPLDADDALDPSFLARTLGVLNDRPDLDFAYTDYRHFGASEIVVRCDDYDSRALIGQNRFAYCTLFRKKVWEVIGGYDPGMALGYEDWDFWIGAVQHGFLGMHVPEVLFRYRVSLESRDTKAREYDAVLKARIIVNHPRLYTPALLAYAGKILAGAAMDRPEGTMALLRKLKLDLWLAYLGRDALLMYRIVRNGIRSLLSSP